MPPPIISASVVVVDVMERVKSWASDNQVGNPEAFARNPPQLSNYFQLNIGFVETK